MTPADLLTTAMDLLERPALATVGGWPPAVALLTWQALETALEEFWRASPSTAGLCDCTRKTHLICLPTYIDPRLAREIDYVWAALSSACHYHPCDLAPTAAELRAGSTPWPRCSRPSPETANRRAGRSLGICGTPGADTGSGAASRT
jgi:hypothetical protein